MICATADAQDTDGREAGLRATRAALDRLGSERPALALVFHADDHDPARVLMGVSSLLGDTPVWGLQSVLPIAGFAPRPRAVVVALLAGADLKAVAQLWENTSSAVSDSDEGALSDALAQSIPPDSVLPRVLLLAADGFTTLAASACEALRTARLPIYGGLASAQSIAGAASVLAGGLAANHALASALLAGSFTCTARAASAWQPAGPAYTVTEARPGLIAALDGQPAIQAYSAALGRTPTEWMRPPLSDLLRVYPLAIQHGGNDAVCSALGVDSSGGLRVNLSVSTGDSARLLIGYPQAGIEALRDAAAQAVADLLPARPELALVFADTAWQQLYAPLGHPELAALREALGAEVPMAGAFTLGQITRPGLTYAPQTLNQHFELVLFGNLP